MNNETEITFEIRDDILKFIQAKVAKYGCTLDELINYFLSEVVKTKTMPFETGDLNDLPPIVSSDELSNRFEDVVDPLLVEHDVIYISHNAELSCVVMPIERYETLITSAEAAKEKTREAE